MEPARFIWEDALEKLTVMSNRPADADPQGAKENMIWKRPGIKRKAVRKGHGTAQKKRRCVTPVSGKRRALSLLIYEEKQWVDAFLRRVKATRLLFYRRTDRIENCEPGGARRAAIMPSKRNRTAIGIHGSAVTCATGKHERRKSVEPTFRLYGGAVIAS
jgi:hypothetical protein